MGGRGCRGKIAGCRGGRDGRGPKAASAMVPTLDRDWSLRHSSHLPTALVQISKTRGCFPNVKGGILS